MKKSGADPAAKNPAAVALGRLRAATMTTEERAAAGKARADSMTKKRRSEIAKKAAAARWAGKKRAE
jgi:hypothetical protein